MSTISQEEIALLRENARKEVELLEKELEEAKERLANKKGQVQAYDLLLDGGSSKDQNLELLPTSAGVFKLDSLQESVIKNPQVSSKNSVKPKKKKRAQRATKAEMERRRKMVAEIFFLNGDLTPKDLNPLVDAVLGEHMEPHHLRAVLRRFEDTFAVRPQHGMWGLTEKGRKEFAQLFGEQELSELDLSTSQMNDVILLQT
ncbi:MAG: hypothetical protein CMK59_11820 [Proteobacteria bacterium]|nr:hypothetical protein [Pseudomonadota bacterium]